MTWPESRIAKLEQDMELLRSSAGKMLYVILVLCDAAEEAGARGEEWETSKRTAHSVLDAIEQASHAEARTMLSLVIHTVLPWV